MAGAVAVSAGVLALLGCGGSEDQSQANTWMGGVCDAVVTWQNDLRTVGSELRDAGVSQKSVEDALSGAQQATDKLVLTLKGIERPEGENAQEAKQAVVDLAGQLDQDKQAITNTIENVDSVDEVAVAATTISTALVTAKQQISDTVETLKDLDVEGDLQEAFEDTTSCDPLQD
jgi:hypothetical protein